MTWPEFVAWHCEQLEFYSRARRGRPSRELAKQILLSSFMRLAEEAMHGRKTSIPGFGIFYLKKRKSCRLLHPSTGKPMQVGERFMVGFHCSKSIKR